MEVGNCLVFEALSWFLWRESCVRVTIALQNRAARVAKLADAPDLGSGGAILRGSSPLPGTAFLRQAGEERKKNKTVGKPPLLVSRLTAIFEEQHFRSRVAAKVKANRAVAADVVLQHTATRAPAVHLVDAEMISKVELAPGLDENGAPGLFFEQRFQRRSRILEVSDRFRRLNLLIVQAASANYPRRR